MKSKYHRNKSNRHIVVRYTLKARKGAPTHLKGWMNDEKNTQWDEAFKMTVGLKSKDHVEAQVVIDIDDNIVVKNWKDGDEETSYEKLIGYFLKNYPEYMAGFIQKTTPKSDTVVEDSSPDQSQTA